MVNNWLHPDYRYCDPALIKHVRKFTNRHVFIGIIGTFLIGTLVGCFASNFASLLIARLIQACASGMLMTFQMTTMISIYPIESAGRFLAFQALLFLPPQPLVQRFLD